MEAVKGNLVAPPQELGNKRELRVLEYIVFDEHVKRSSVPLLSAHPFDLSLPIEGLAICQSKRRKSPTELRLCFCSSDWEVDSEQVWESQDQSIADSTSALKARAGELFENLGKEWVFVGQPDTRAVPRWQFWR